MDSTVRFVEMVPNCKRVIASLICIILGALIEPLVQPGRVGRILAGAIATALILYLTGRAKIMIRRAICDDAGPLPFALRWLGETATSAIVGLECIVGVASVLASSA